MLDTNCCEREKDRHTRWLRKALFRESIAYPYMDFQKSTVFNMDIRDFGCQYSIIHVDITIDIQAGISMQGHSTMDVREIWMSTNIYPYLWI